MPWWVTLLLEVAKLWKTQAAVAVLIVIVVLVLLAVRWVRGYHRQTLILMRSVACHMIQNRPPNDDATRVQQNLNWWETEVISILPRAGAKSGEIARFGALGNVYHPTLIAEKIARLDAIIDRLEGQAYRPAPSSGRPPYNSTNSLIISGPPAAVEELIDIIKPSPRD